LLTVLLFVGVCARVCVICASFVVGLCTV